MADDKFEIRQIPRSADESFLQTVTPDFGALLQRNSQKANVLIEARGLLAKGVLPEVQVALEDSAHNPNDHVHKQLLGIGQLDLDYDDHGKLASARLDYGHGNTEDAKFVDGHIVENRLRGQFNTDYTFHANGSVASENFQSAANSNQYYEFDEKGNLTLGVESNADHTTTLLDNEPGHHDIVMTGTNGNRATLNYDNNQQFQNGDLRSATEIWGLRPGKDGEAEVFPERKT
jgi:hypothetical protein